jgi:putative endonuclease
MSMRLFSRMVFGFVAWAARNGFASEGSSDNAAPKGNTRRRTGLRGETYAYWYLRRHGYTIIARNFTVPGVHGEIDLIGYDGNVLAFVEVKTRHGEDGVRGLPEDAVTRDKRRNLSRVARQFLAFRRIRQAPCRFDVVAIESRPGHRPVVRLHKGAFADQSVA